jgi:AcrR family transcriptional regulator
MTAATQDAERTTAGTAPSAVTPRDRLIEGLLASVEERGYAATTVVDIVRHARVSKRTFYEHFSNKDDTLRALYQTSVAFLQQWIADAAGQPGTWQERLHACVAAFTHGLAAYPGFARTVLVEMASTGPLSLAAHEKAHRRFAEQTQQVIEMLRRDAPELRPIEHDMARAFIGAIYELMTRELSNDHIDAAHVADIGTRLLTLIITAPA